MGIIYYGYKFNSNDVNKNLRYRVYMINDISKLIWVSDYDKIERLCFTTRVHIPDDPKYDKLPKNLKFLECTGNNITELSDLPDGLEVLKCSRNKIKRLPNVLPTKLKYMDISHNEIDVLPICLLEDTYVINLSELNNLRGYYYPRPTLFTGKIVRIRDRFTCNGNYLKAYHYIIFNNNPVCELIKKMPGRNKYNQKLIRYLDKQKKGSVLKIED